MTQSQPLQLQATRLHRAGIMDSLYQYYPSRRVSLLFLCVISHGTSTLGFAPSTTQLAFCRPGSRFDLREFDRRRSWYSMPPDGPRLVILGDDDDDFEDDDDDDDDDEVLEDPYKQMAVEEFRDPAGPSSALTLNGGEGDLVTIEDWGGALGKLRQRVGDVESGLSQDPSHALFRLMSSESPNMVIGKFVRSANPQTVQAMSGAVSSLLGGLSNPNMGVETVVKASGDKIGNLCFQLQMTGYLFRNAEYLLALKDLLKIKPTASMEDYKDAFDRLDVDGSGYIESTEIRRLFDSVYDGNSPQVEIDVFLQFFDQNNDGRISWEEFEMGLGVAAKSQGKQEATAFLGLNLEQEDEEDDDEIIDISADVSGTIEVEMDDGEIVQVDAKDYVESLKAEARMLKEELRRERRGLAMDGPTGPDDMLVGGGGPIGPDNSMDIAQYIASRQGDVKALTEGISPEIVETMKRLVDFVLENGENGGNGGPMTDVERAEMEMEIPGAALQQLALWQLVLGYRLREEEATGEYKRLLQS